ncbi:DUF1828 domain-containing protein [Cognatilysobacter tabacisoli]|uniref:DUF1828 domain-containing protein n=1 Tax=Cognatilysobacter tabacisoli TaxID=2315424 RepID=UPI000E6B2C1F|nr:DUF1828 domain-containing protein [Lysobacter tabacisoli]
MNHDAIATALCGRYVKLAEGSGYLESNWTFPGDGTLIGAYIVAADAGRIRVTDDGDIVFNAAVAGARLTRDRASRYRALAEDFGLTLGDDGVISATCSPDELPFAVARYVQAASAIAHASLKHRPRDNERFERIIGTLLEAQFGKRIVRRPEVVGISGHQLRFPFGLDLDGQSPALIQTISADDNQTSWKSVYEAGGKFGDIRPARPGLRLIAVLESAKDTEKAGRYFADAADVVVYDGGALALAA